MRAAAKDGDFKSFRKGIADTLDDNEKMQLMMEVREGMGL